MARLRMRLPSTRATACACCGYACHDPWHAALVGDCGCERVGGVQLLPAAGTVPVGGGLRRRCRVLVVSAALPHRVLRPDARRRIRTGLPGAPVRAWTARIECNGLA